MSLTPVYFATNRTKNDAMPFGFGNNSAPYNPQTITFARADVDNVNLANEDSGVIRSISDVTTANFSSKATAEIVGAKKNLMIFIHGFDNSFSDAIKRAAFNREWFAESGVAAADTTVIAFSWPSAGKLLDTIPNPPPEAYLADQVQAGLSAFPIAYFLQVVDQLQRTYREANPTGRVFLLAHSMGNHALSGAIQLWMNSNDPRDLIFDEVILAAGDEVATTLEMPSVGQMSGLRSLAKRTSIYHSQRDVAMYLSTAINLNPRLGFDGPPNKRNEAIYPPQLFRIIDCTQVCDYALLVPPDATHQYYRRSHIVRSDISMIFGGAAATGGIGSLSS